MPLVYDESLWSSLYWIEGKTYGRDFGILPADGDRMVDRIETLTQIGAVQNASVLFVGTAFGFEMEYALSLGISDVWGIDPSPYVWANTDQIDPAVLPRLINASVGVDSTADIQALLAAAGMGNPQRFDYIVDCDAISSQIDDAGINAFLDGLEELLQGNQNVRIIHFTTPLLPNKGPGDSAILWKTMQEWQAYRPDHTWVDAVTRQVI